MACDYEGYLKKTPCGECVQCLGARAKSAEAERDSLRAQLAESRAAVEVLRGYAAKCPRCHGRGMRSVHCWKCDDSGEDHDDCPDDVPCDHESHGLLASLPASSRAYAERVAALERVASAARSVWADTDAPDFRTHDERVLGDALAALAALPPEEPAR